MFTPVESGNTIPPTDGIEGWDPTVNVQHTELQLLSNIWGKQRTELSVLFDFRMPEDAYKIVLFIMNFWFFQALHVTS